MVSADIINNIDESGQIVIFELNKEFYGLNVALIESIERLSRITRVPRTKEHILGVINLRGDIVPVISLSKMTDNKPAEYTEAARIIILQLPEYKVGFIVDSVAEIAFMDESMLQSNQQLFKEDKLWIEAVYRFKDSYVMLLDIETLLNRGGF